jgi:hypothetical protein
MQQPETLQKYRLFPKQPAATNGGKTVEYITPAPAALVQAGDKVDKQPALNGLMKRLNKHAPSRHHKFSVLEIGSMPMVHELTMVSRMWFT